MGEQGRDTGSETKGINLIYVGEINTFADAKVLTFWLLFHIHKTSFQKFSW